jgi:hypothetical protein
MTNYDWQRMAHDLATEVMGWCFNSSHQIYTDDLGCRKVNKSDWRPYEDLNQAWMLGQQKGQCLLSFWVNAEHESEAHRCRIHQDEHASEALHKSPAKAIMLAVAKAIDLNLSDYEVSDGT